MQEYSKGTSALMFSAMNGHLEIVELLLDSGVDINLKNYSGNIALYMANRFSHSDIAELLHIAKSQFERVKGKK